MSKPQTAKNIQIPDSILREMLTDSEWRMLRNRWQIINLLEEGISIRKIAEQVKVGTDTVVRVARMVEKGNLRKILDKEKNPIKKLKTQTPWIFGKSG
ncbi:MAG: hypothetical protein C4584_01330 [Armatimonadetes bacterium]|nr:MAG: hypothetical protein C4584_01330 [Armatimonadota bacterium]